MTLLSDVHHSDDAPDLTALTVQTVFSKLLPVHNLTTGLHGCVYCYEFPCEKGRKLHKQIYEDCKSFAEV